MMRVGHLSIGYVFLLVGITASCRPGDGAEPISCLESVFAEHAASQRAWQESLRDIIVSQRPEFAELASISKQLQLAMIDMTEARFHYVIASPERLEGQYGISEFVDLGVVVRQADSLRAINNGHPDWPPLRAYVTEELMGAPAFTGALERFQRLQREINSKLAACAME
jgi:hypothetical protein